MRRGVPVTTESELRRWCWDLDWLAFDQDEDILLFEEHWIVPMLEEARDGCPKREYVLEIVAHGIRDRAYRSIGGELFVPPVIDAARAAGADDLVAYLERLARYARSGEVDEAEARSRVHDLAMCRPPETVSVERVGSTWRGALDDDETLVIDAYNGRMCLE